MYPVYVRVKPVFPRIRAPKLPLSSRKFSAIAEL